MSHSIEKVTRIYRGFEITAEKDLSLGGDEMLYYSVFRQSDGWEMCSNFTSGSDSPLTLVNILSDHVDDYFSHPEDYDG